MTLKDEIFYTGGILFICCFKKYIIQVAETTIVTRQIRM